MSPAIHSPFNGDSFNKGRNTALLLQFLMMEIFTTFDTQNPAHIFCRPSLFPFQGLVGSWHKLKEHAALLAPAFPHPIEELFLSDCFIKTLNTMDENNFQSHCKQLFSLLEPALQKHKEDETIIYFFLRNREKIERILYPKNLKTFMLNLHPQGIEKLCTSTCYKFEKKGFSSLIPQLLQLFSYV